MVWNRAFFIFLMFVSIQTFAQSKIFNISLKDKEGSTYSLDKPEEFFSQRALDRKIKYNIPITEQDLPVSSAYLATINSYNVDVLHTSKWFNSVLVKSDDATIDQIKAEPFVKSVELVANDDNIPISGRVTRHSRAATKKAVVETGFLVETNALQNKMLQVNEMHDMGFRGEDMLVAIFDSGFEEVDKSSYYDHLRANDQIVFTRDFIGNSGNVYQYDSHGANAFSVMAAYKPDNFIGVVYDADFVLCVTENITSEYRVEEYYWTAAAELADSLGVDVINSSLAYTTFDDSSMDYTYQDMDGKTAIVSQAARIAASKGMIVVCSVGNDGNKPWKYLNAPSDADSVLAIGAMGGDLLRSAFSSFGPSADGRIKPDLCALGSSVRVVKGESVGSSNGTSFATPLIAGLTAGFWQAFPDMSNYDVMEYLKLTASNSTSPDTVIGYGLPNFIDAYNKAADIEEKVEETFIVYPNPTDKTKIFVASQGFLEIGKVKVNFADFKGVPVKSISVDVYSLSSDLEIDVSDLTKGYYLAEFIVGDKRKLVKLIIL